MACTFMIEVAVLAWAITSAAGFVKDIEGVIFHSQLAIQVGYNLYQISEKQGWGP